MKLFCALLRGKYSFHEITFGSYEGEALKKSESKAGNAA